MQTYIIVLIAVAYIIIGHGNCKKQSVLIGGLFEDINQDEEIAFRVAIDIVNNRKLLNYHLKPVIANIETEFIINKTDGSVIEKQWDAPYTALTKTCSLLEQGIAVMFTSVYDNNANTVQSICDHKEIPVIRTVVDELFENECCSINLFPHPAQLSKAFADVVQYWNWNSFTVVFDFQYTFENIQEILKLYNSTGRVVLFEYLYQTEKGNFRDALKKIRDTKQTNFVYHFETEFFNNIMKQTQEVGMLMRKYSFILITLDMHIIDLHEFQYSEANIVSMRLFDPSSPMITNIASDLQAKRRELGLQFINMNADEYAWQLQSTVFLMVDAVMLFVETLKQFSMQFSGRPLFCDGTDNWEHGNTISNFLKTTTIDGTTGIVQFDHQGIRSNFDLEVVELQEKGLVKIGSWNPMDGLIISKFVPTFKDNDPTSLRGIHLKISICLSIPYVFFKNSTISLNDNNQFDGFVIDLINQLSEMEGFHYTFILNKDNKNGEYNISTGKWDGMIGDILSGDADLAISDLTITREREEFVDFTSPFLALGTQIIYSKPTKAQPNFFSFAAPFAPSVWVFIGASFISVTLGLYLMSRICQAEWDNWDPCIKNPKYLENQFDVKNSLWYVAGCFMQQGADIFPRGASTRVLSSTWAFLILIMVSYYKACLAAFLTTEVNELAFNSVEELVNRAEKLGIKYGAVLNEASHKYFQHSQDAMYKRIGMYMDKHPENMVHTVEEGFDMLLKQNYAFFHDSLSIKYAVKIFCQLISVGDLLDERYYGIALKKDSPYRNRFSSAILHLQQTGVLDNLERKWWVEDLEGETCQEPEREPYAPPLNHLHVAGMFWITFAGIFIACIVAVIECGLHTLKTCKRNRTPLLKELKEEVIFYFSFGKMTKPVKSENVLVKTGND